MTDQIKPTWTDSALNEIVTTDPETIRLYRETVAAQINASRALVDPIREIIDLDKFVADIVIQTSAQGSSLLEIHIIDPGWITLRRDANGVAFFDVDEAGFLWPPIDLNFPPDVSDAQWRLCQLRPSTDLSTANIVLTFEDKVSSVLREFQGPVQSNPNETRAEFIRRLVKEATVGGHLPPVTNTTTGITSSPVIGMPDGSIRFISLLPNVAFSQGDLTTDQVHLPASAKQPNAPPARANPNKHPGGGNYLPHSLQPISTQLSIAEGFSAVPLNLDSTPFVLPPNLISKTFGIPPTG